MKSLWFVVALGLHALGLLYLMFLWDCITTAIWLLPQYKGVLGTQWTILLIVYTPIAWGLACAAALYMLIFTLILNSKTWIRVSGLMLVLLLLPPGVAATSPLLPFVLSIYCLAKALRD